METKKIGILGGGQLSRMLVTAGHRIGLNPLIYCDSSSDPAAQVCQSSIFGRQNNTAAIKKFFSKVDIVLFENEFVDCKVLERQSNQFDIKFLPSLKTMTVLQNKLGQKKILNDLQIPTSSFEAYKNGEDLKKWVQKVLKRFNGQCVFKWSVLGYDGQGVLVCKHQNENIEKIVSFLQQALDQKIPVFVEEKLLFKKELALVSTYSIEGEMVYYPCVIVELQEGICRWVRGPALAFGVATAVELKIRE
ncbi:MAG: ATP-grasp domain-containing protein, partial [Deltaproteobacteria bacterium]|nr:ATP-grasp domain-containing protein [Deltaproteobacteria bacterium]